MHIPLMPDPKGSLLLVGLEHAADVAAALTVAGVKFTELDQEGAGCAGPNLLALRLPHTPDAQELVDSALADL